MINIYSGLVTHYFFSLWMCPFESKVSLGCGEFDALIQSTTLVELEKTLLKNSQDCTFLKGELQRQTKLISSKSPSKSCKMRLKSFKSAKPFSRYSTLKIDI